MTITGREKVFPRLLLEGTRLTFKTEIVLALRDHPSFLGQESYPYHVPMASAEWTGFTAERWGRSLVNYESSEAARALEIYEHWLGLFELMPFCPWLVERFHLSTQAFQLQHRGVLLPFSQIDQRMRRAGFVMAFMHRREETFTAARAVRLKYSENPAQYEDLRPFADRQKVLVTLAQNSEIPCKMVDISDNDVPRAVASILDWLQSIGVLRKGSWSRRQERRK